jgi:hypothetical protein
MEGASFSKTLMSTLDPTWSQNPEDYHPANARNEGSKNKINK